MQRIREHGSLHPFSVRHCEHFSREIGGCDCGVRQLALDRKRQVAASTGEVEHAIGLPRLDHLCCSIPPPEVNAAAQQMIREIVASRDSIEHRPYNRRLLGIDDGVGAVGHVRRVTLTPSSS